MALAIVRNIAPHVLLFLVVQATWPGCAVSPDPRTEAEAVARGVSTSTDADECQEVENVEGLSRAPRSTDKAWIERSDEGVRKLAAFWPPTERFTEFMRPDPDDEQSLYFQDPRMDFEATRTSRGKVRSNALACDLVAVFFKHELALAEARCFWQADTHKVACLSQRYHAIFARLGMSFEHDQGIARAEFAEVVAAMHRARLAELGEPADYALVPAPDTPAHLVAAERQLSDPIAGLSVGSSGYMGLPPPGFEEAKQLVDTHAIDALRRVLRSANPEGRGFAAIGLGELNALSKDDLRVIDRLERGPPIMTRSGCIVYVEPSNEFFSVLGSSRMFGLANGRDAQ